MTCKNCGNIKKNYEEFFSVSLEVKNQKNIFDSLKKWSSEDIISGYHCEACDQKTELIKRNAISKLPNTLIFSLSRIFYDFEKDMNVKLNSRFEFPQVLNMKDNMENSIIKDQEKLSKQDKNKETLEKDSSMKAESPADEEGKMDDSEEAKAEDVSMKEQSDNTEPIETEMIDENEEKEEDEDANYQYKLVGVIIHMGMA